MVRCRALAIVESVDSVGMPRVWVYRWPVEVKQAQNKFQSPSAAGSRCVHLLLLSPPR